MPAFSCTSPSAGDKLFTAKGPERRGRRCRRAGRATTPEAHGCAVGISPAGPAETLLAGRCELGCRQQGDRVATCLGAQVLDADKLMWNPSPTSDRHQLLWPKLLPLWTCFSSALGEHGCPQQSCNRYKKSTRQVSMKIKGSNKQLGTK